MNTTAVQPSTTLAEQLCPAVNSHDIDRVVDLFADDYVNETPAHPARGFRGREQVRRNWTQLFAAVPDIGAQVLRADQVGETLWSEWEMRGNRRDGARHLMRGVMIFRVRDEKASAVRFYVEPVDDAGGPDADEALEQILAQDRS